MIDKIQINSYRSIIGMNLDISSDLITTICGVNNVGKTNILRAIDLFFRADVEAFRPEDDVPHHIQEGSRGGNYKVDIKVTFKDKSGTVVISQKYIPKSPTKDAFLQIDGHRISDKKAKTILTIEECRDIIFKYRVFFIEANRTDLNLLVQDIFIDEILPDIDKRRSRQTQSLQELNTFIDSSKKILKSIENDVTENIKHFTLNVEGISSQQWEAKVAFPEFLRLRQAITRLVSLTVNDANDKDLEFKGSGVQKIILLAIMRYLSTKSDYPILWLLDEPEAFLQPALQKEVFKQLGQLCAHFPIIVTTHSPHFVDINRLEHTHLVTARYEPKTFTRKSTRKYIATFTEISGKQGYDKIKAIKDQLGIERNDSWMLTPFNIIVEGEDDKNYLECIYNRLGISIPNILIAGSSSKIKGYVQFLHEFTKDSGILPIVVCLLDHDPSGKLGYNEINPAKYKNMHLYRQYVVRENNTKQGNLNYEFEDVFPSSLILEAINAFLKKRGYLKLTSKSLNHRYSPANNDKPILDWIRDLVTQRNPTQPRLNLQDDGVKKFINAFICNRINKMTEEEFHLFYDANKGLQEMMKVLQPEAYKQL
ncbi:ATP-dependent nuclease [Deinococcus rufus]|uniref:ATP-dependent endonuclease n=1 Tax=Deinococcus rufus TaxID=2136097 RepID=A0ABV7ZBC2_9DEIO